MPAEREQRGSPPAHATGAVEFVAVEDIAADETFRLRAEGDVSQLATALGRLGQLAPVELRPWPGAAAGGASPRPPTTAQPGAAREASAGAEGAAAGPRWQVVSGFRRLAAIRMLARERVLARLHHELSEEDAWALALGEALLHEPLTGEDLEALRERLRSTGLAAWAVELVDEALVRAPVAAELRERFYEFLTGAGSPGTAAPDQAIEAVTPDASAVAEATATAMPTATPTSPPTSSPAPAAEPSQARDPSSTAPAAEPSWSRAPAPGGDETPPGVPHGERGQGSTPTATADAAADATSTPAAPDPAAQVAPVDEPAAVSVEPGPADGYVEVTPDELVQDLVARLSALNQDLATAVEAWEDLPVEGRRALVDQARYVAAVLPFMETQD